jgi:AcrR family transcriptional regulator
MIGSEMAAETDSQSRRSRPYHLGQRQATVNETRAKIMNAARELILSERALAGFSVDAVAKQAGVVRATVYNQFGNKRGLLEALFDDVARRGGMFELGHAFHKEDALEALNMFVATFGRFWTVDRLLIRRLHAMITLDPEMGEADAARQERRRAGLRVIVSKLDAQYSLVADFELSDMIEILYTLTSFETFDALAGTTRSPEEIIPTVQKLILDVLGLDVKSLGNTIS